MKCKHQWIVIKWIPGEEKAIGRYLAEFFMCSFCQEIRTINRTTGRLDPQGD